ncbi:MAG: hypothetical protein GDA53_01725 [Rhodobacteraceae bacterium]|nr:hypothetical protein [Paracoccaceae bacterium]
MSLVTNILRAYRAPRAALGNELAQLAEPRTLMIGILFCLLTFVARMPEVAAVSFAAGDDAATRNGRYGAMFVSTILFAPLMMYFIAGLAHALLRPFGGRATWGEARLVFFWATLVTAPLVLMSGALKVFSPGPAFLIAQLVTAMVFLWQWITCIAATEFGAHGSKPAQDTGKQHEIRRTGK